jgi:hypothetical protein
VTARVLVENSRQVNRDPRRLFSVLRAQNVWGSSLAKDVVVA